MKCLLIFDSLNDIIFMKHNDIFCKYIQKLAVLQGLIPEESKDAHRTDFKLEADIVMQLFSPLITSQRVMLNHFSNPYSSIACYDGLNIIFDEFVGYLFVAIGYDSVYWLKRYLGVFLSIVKHVCGLDLSTLKANKSITTLISRLLDVWYSRIATEQTYLVEAIEQLRVPSKVSSICLKALTESTEKIKSSVSVSQVHAFIMVDHRFLCLYSTRNAAELLLSDVTLLSLVGEAVEPIFDGNSSHKTCDEDKEPAKYEKSKLQSNYEIRDTMDDFVFLLGKQKPYAVHVSHIARNIPIFLLYEICNDHVNSALYETLQSLCSLHDLHARGTTDREVIHSCVEVVDNSFKKLTELFKKKSFSSNLDKTCLNNFKVTSKKWDALRKQYQEYLKTHNIEWLQKIDSTVDSIISMFRSIYSSCVFNLSIAHSNHKAILPIIQNIQRTLRNVKEILNESEGGSLGIGLKSTLNINKYLEEFPGLVHFIYIDRITHRFVAPCLDFSSKETTNMTRKKVWNMVKFAWSHLQEGRTALMWKDSIFNYSHFLWFEDVSGTPLKPKISPTAVVKTLPQLGYLHGDFYHQLIKKCFPSVSTQRIRCYELFSVHLGLVTSSCVLEQSRRLTATIWEVTGVPTNPLDLL
ncbi:uncharacterized protein HPS1 [Planococcus citri]|uniref:uncharacterized protein HPS1 n=1 Tax=Planococcus citri TaxID=170843 RepID=UPI0031F87764